MTAQFQYTTLAHQTQAVQSIADVFNDVRFAPPTNAQAIRQGTLKSLQRVDAERDNHDCKKTMRARGPAAPWQGPA